MKKHFTTALVMAAAVTSVNAQVLKYDGQAVTLNHGEEKVDTVNWYWNGDIEDFDGEVLTGVKDDEAQDELAVKVVTNSECNDWERVFKFDGLTIKPATIYRVRLTAKALSGTPVLGVAMMCGDENKDMAFVAPDGDGYQQFKTDLGGWGDTYTTKSAMFYYTSDEYQQQIYPNIKPEDTEALGANRFLRLTFKGQAEYMVDQVLVEEAAIAGITFNKSVVKVDFGFPTNAAALAKADERGSVLLDTDLFTVTVDGEKVKVISAELKQDGGTYLFLEKNVGKDKALAVSFNNAEGCGLTYSGVLTPGNGTDVKSFEGEAGTYDNSLSVTSYLQEAAKCISTSPANGSFELENTVSEFTFNFDRKIWVVDDMAPQAVLSSAELDEDEELELVEQDDELATSVTFKRTGTDPLPDGAYTIEVRNIYNEMETLSEDDGIVPTLDFEVGVVKVAEIITTPVATVWMDPEAEANSIPAGWTCYKKYTETVKDDEGNAVTDDEGNEVKEEITEEWAGGSSCRAFKFSPDGVAATGFYICDRDDAYWTLKYGHKEDAKLHLPAGDIDFGVTAVGWQGQHPKVEYWILDQEGNEIAKGDGTLEKTVGAAGEVIAEYDRIQCKFNVKAEGDYILVVHNTAGIGAGAQILGFDVKSYKMGEGASAESVVLINEDFGGVGNGNVPAAGEGWTVYDNGNPGAKGQAQSGRNRMMNLGSCENMTIGFYNRCFGEPSAYNMTYGETEAGEPAFHLKATKYNFSWFACNWKSGEAGNTYYFQILNEDGTVVYEREDQVLANVNGGNQSAVAEKIEFTWTPAEEGDYVLNWYMTGESVVGKIKVEQMGSMAVFYKNLLAEAVATAREERDKVNDDLYAGTTRDALDAAIDKAAHPNFHTGAEYMAAIEELNSYVDAMKARTKAMAEYSNVLGKCADLLAELEDTKYEALDAYVQLKQLYNTYNEVAPGSLENDELLPVQANLTASYNYVLNMKNNVVALYTKQLETLIEQLVAVDTEDLYGENEAVLAAGNALTDDQSLAGKLKLMVTAAIYDRCAEGNSLFEKVVDEETEEVDAVTMDMTGYIQNANVYCTTDKNHKEGMDAATAMQKFPGWTIVGTTNVAWSWDAWNVTEENPAGDGRFATPWGGSVNVKQQLTSLPAGIYTYTVDTGDGSHIGEYDAETNTFNDGFENKSSIFYAIGDETVAAPFNLANSNPWRGMATAEMADIELLPQGGHSLATLTIGADMVADTDFANVDNFRLIMTAKAPNFDYAKAAAAVKEDIANAIIAPEERNDAPESVVYYNMAGMKTTQPKGVVIKMERWSDGYMRVSKVVKK